MKLVEIHWVDSMGFSGSWCDPKDLQNTNMGATTFGYLVDETEDAYIVSTSICLHNNIVYSPLKIPKVSVTGFWEITL